MGLFLYLYPQQKLHNVKKVTWKMGLFKVMKTPISIIYLFTTLNLPFMALLIVSVVSVIAAVLPVYIVIFLTNKVAPGLICKPTEYFVILVLSSFILVYCPSYIKRVICKTPFVTHIYLRCWFCRISFECGLCCFCLYHMHKEISICRIFV